MNNTKKENLAYLAPFAEMILLNIDNCIMQVSPGGNEGGGGNENYAPFPDFGEFDLLF